MNSQCEPAAAAPADALNLFPSPARGIEPIEYRTLTGADARDLLRRPTGAAQGETTATGVERPERGGYGVYNAAEREAMEAARQQAFAEGEREGRKAVKLDLEAQCSTQVACERERVTAAVEAFRSARERYFADAEQEVVKLALAIAARVLHREAQVDPLLLLGAVRVALETMADRSSVVLRVATQDANEWERALGIMQPHERPRVAEDSRLQRGECALETTMGTVELGVKVQLEEIEKGFFDLLNKRPTE